MNTHLGRGRVKIWIFTAKRRCEIWGSHGGEHRNYSLLGCDAVESGINLQMSLKGALRLTAFLMIKASLSLAILVYRCHMKEDCQQDSYITFPMSNARFPSHKGHIIAQNDLTNVTSRSHKKIKIFCPFPLPYLSFRTDRKSLDVFLRNLVHRNIR